MTEQIEPTRETTGVVFKRVAAYLLDTIVLIGLLLALLAVFQFVDSIVDLPIDSISDSTASLLGRLLAILLLLAYGTLLEGLWNGQTIGKRVLGIKVVGPKGANPSIGQVFVRNVPAILIGLGWLAWLPYGIALLSIAASDRRQRVFDSVAATYVVAPPRYERREHTGSVPVAATYVVAPRW